MVKNDPVEFVHRYKNKEDQEIIGFLASQFAYGKIEVFKRFLETLFIFLGPSPAHFIEKGDFSSLKGLYYRFQKERDILLLIDTLRRIQSDFGGIGSMVDSYYEGDLREALWKIRPHLFPDNDDLTFFFPKPSITNPLKRWNLYARWMVRKDAIDIGLWDFMNKKDLIVPLDTHIFKIGQCLGWTRRASQCYNAARDITEVLKSFSPEDPLLFDLFLCHRIGIKAGCTGKKNTRCEKVCLLYEV